MIKIKNKKALAERQHFKNRLQERYGLAINKEGYENIIKAIETKQRVEVSFNGHKTSLIASYRAMQSKRVSVWLLMLKGIAEPIPVAYDEIRKELITTHPDLLISHKNL